MGPLKYANLQSIANVNSTKYKSSVYHSARYTDRTRAMKISTALLVNIVEASPYMVTDASLKVPLPPL